MNDTFQESGENFRNAEYFAINVVKNALTQDGIIYRLVQYPLPPS